MATTLPEFNPSKDHRVQLIKNATEALLDYCQSLRKDSDADHRCLALAETNYEQAAMWAVKSIFVKDK